MMGRFRAVAQRGALSSALFWISGEIFIVVAGVLIAFGLNAWWVERQTQAEEQTHLRALTRDFERNVSLYNELIVRAALGSSASLELLQLARAEPNAEPASVGRLMGNVFQSFRQEPALDAYQALVNSAGLALIRDDELRSRLAGFADRATDPYQERFADQFYMTFLTSYVGGLQIAGAVARDGTQPQSFADVLNDSAFQEHLALRYVLERDVARTYCALWDEAETILEQLRVQIEMASSLEETLPVEPSYCISARAEPRPPATSTTAPGSVEK
jgi:hypothetical protein